MARAWWGVLPGAAVFFLIIRHIDPPNKAIVDWAQVAEAVILFASAIVAFGLYYVTRNAPLAGRAFTQIANQMRDRDLLTAFDRWRRIRAKYGAKLSYETVIDHDGESGFDSGGHFVRNDRDCVLHVLNYYESWGIGIRRQALDERMLKDWWRSTLVKDFIDLYPFIAGYRRANGIETAFNEFQALALSWATRAERAEITQIMRRRAVARIPEIRPARVAA